MVRARPLADDPVLLGRQRELAALKVVGSGVDASPGRHRQDDHHRPRARAPRRHHAALARARSSPRAGCSASGATSSPHGAPGRGLPPLAPNVERARARPSAARSPARSARFDRALGERPGVVLVANGVLDRHPAELRRSPGTCCRRRGAALRQPRHRGPPRARAAAHGRGRRLLAADRHAARQERRAPRRARRARASATRR